MRFKRLVIPMVLIVMACSWQAGAYNLFTGDPVLSNRCSQCHTTFTMSGEEHSAHTGAVECSTCHVGGVGFAPVETSACTDCHPTTGYPETGLFALHGGLEAPNGHYCGYCHENVPTSRLSWSEMKALYRK